VLRTCQFLLFFLSTQADSFPLSSSPHKRIPIRTLCLRHRASTFQSVLFVFGAVQAHTNPYYFSLAPRNRIPIRTLCLREFTHVCTSQSQVECGPKPIACLSWPVPTARYSAAANLVVPIASIGYMGSALLPRSSPWQTTLAAKVLLPLLPPA